MKRNLQTGGGILSGFCTEGEKKKRQRSEAWRGRADRLGRYPEREKQALFALRPLNHHSNEQSYSPSQTPPFRQDAFLCSLTKGRGRLESRQKKPPEKRERQVTELNVK